MKTIRWGIIGCGDVTEVKSGPGFYKTDNSKLVAVMRRNGDRAEDYARRHNVSRWHDNADAIINAPDIDAVYIATFTNTHCEYVLRCAAAGKHVYVEKPMAMTPAECAKMIAACRSAGVALWVGYYRRALPRFLKVKTLVESGAVGDIRTVASWQFQRLDNPTGPGTKLQWRIDPTLSGGGLFFEAACHTFDFLDFMFGPITDIRGFAANQAGAYQPEDLVTASYRFSSGVFGSGIWCYCADHNFEMNEIIGTTGRLQFSTTKPVPIRIIRDDAVEEIVAGDPPHVHQPLIETIIEQLNGRGSCPSTGETAARTAEVMERILKEFRASAHVASTQHAVG